MRKRLRKSIAGILALLMVVTNFQLNNLMANAEETTTEEKTYTMAEMGNPVKAWDVVAEDSTGGGKKLTFAANYKSIFYAVPAELAEAEITQITFNVESVSGIEGAAPWWFGYKMYTEEMYTSDAGGNGIGEGYSMYGNPVREVPADLTAPVKYLAITSANNEGKITGPIDMEISGITFTVKKSVSSDTVSDGNQSGDVTGGDNGNDNAGNDGGNDDVNEPNNGGDGGSTPEQTTEVTYNFIDLEKYNSWDVNMSVGKGGEATFAYTKQHGEAFFKLPQGIDASKVREIKLNVTGGSEGDLSLKLYDEVTTSYKEAIQLTYPGISIVPNATFVSFGIMSINANGGSAKISGVTFTVADTLENVEINKTYTFNDLVADKNGGVSANVDSTNGAVTYSYTDRRKEVFYAIPKEIDTAKVHKVTFNVSSGNGDTLAYKFYTEDNYSGDWPSAPDEQVSYCNPSAVIASGFAGMKYFGIMSMNAEEYSAVVDSVTFHTTGWGYSEGAEDDSEDDTTGGGTTESDELTFTAGEVYVQWGSATSEQLEGKINIAFANQYDQVKIQLPQSINMANCESVKFVVADQNIPIALKLWVGTEEKERWVQYGKSGSTEYIVTPNITDTIDVVGIMCSEDSIPEGSQVSFISVTFKMKEGSSSGSSVPENLGENIIINGNFADADVSMWNSNQGSSVISATSGDTAIFDDVKSYGVIDRTASDITDEKSTGHGFVQDVTDRVVKGGEYYIEFYAMLSDDYANAPDEQKMVEFLPYFVLDGSNNYLGAAYSSELSGFKSQPAKVGEWTKYSGYFTISCRGEEDRVVLRFMEQGTDYGSGDCVQGDYYITGVSMRQTDKPVPEIPEIEQDIPDWKDTIVNDLGTGTIAGTAVTYSEMRDETLWELVTKHYNAVTFGNELKLDAMIGNAKGQTEHVTFNGVDLEVPVLNHSTTKAMLDKILAWNEENPDKPIKVRGHVLVWHSQAPTWFFKENYDADAAYVSKEVMDLRLEWYIKTMMDFYVGPNSPYKDLFYGWDVVNEAINDGTNTYRGAGESNWAAVYGDQSNEYIIKAFRWANKYAPASLELYYNDYNDCVPAKVEGIVKLLEAVKAAEGTRIDGMGMQGHHKMDNPSVEQVDAAVRAYCAVVGKVQWTELDINADGSGYDGTDATRDEVYSKMAHRYKAYYDVLKKLDAEDGIEVGGIIFWGTVDKYSWLQTSNSVGGASNGGNQCPLLFDDNYKAKPAYWAFVDPSKLTPEVQNIIIAQKVDDEYTSGPEYSMEKGTTKATVIPMWDETGLKVVVKVQDASIDASDAVTVYVDPAMKAGETTPIKVTVKRADADTVEGGYQAKVAVPLDAAGVSKKVALDVVIVNGTESIAFNDTTFTQESSSKYYAIGTMKISTTVTNGTIIVDGEVDDKWAEVDVIPLTINLGAKVESAIKLLWDKNYLYILAEVKDDVLNKDNSNAWEQDSIEVFIDENNKKTSAYDADDKQYRINYLNEQSFGSQKNTEGCVTSATKVVDGGYVVEAAFEWTDITPINGTNVGLELQINDASAEGKRAGTLSWADETGMGYAGSNVFGTITLVGEEIKEPEVTPSPEPEVTPSPEPEVTPTPDADEVLKEMVEELSVLVDDNATKEEKLLAVKDIVAEVKELVNNGKLDEVLEANVEYIEDLFEEAIGKVLNIVNKENKVPEIKSVVGALISVDADKDAKMVFEAVAAPSLDAKFKNAFAFDAKLFAGEEAVQPLVPVTIRMTLPPSIDKTKKVVVLHYADGTTTPEKLESKIVNNDIEIITSHFSTFVIVNEVEQQNNNNAGSNAGNNAPAATSTPAPAPSTDSGVKAPATGDSAYPIAVVAVLLLTGSAAVIMARRKKEEKEDK